MRFHAAKFGEPPLKPFIGGRATPVATFVQGVVRVTVKVYRSGR
jgi:hypothetical protein